MENTVKPNVGKRITRILEIAKRMAQKTDGRDCGPVTSRIEEMEVHCHGYAEPGYSSDSGFVVTGNWTDVWRSHEKVSELPGRLFDIFEKMGVAGEWGDEWSSCYGCYKLVRTSGDSYSWKPHYAIVGGSELLCQECIKENPEDYLEDLIGNGESCVTFDLDLTAHGYLQLNEDSYESGWHPGQNDNPREVAKKLREHGVDRFIFKLDENSQFYSKWSVYVWSEPDECESCHDNAREMDWSVEDKAWYCGDCGHANMPTLPKLDAECGKLLECPHMVCQECNATIWTDEDEDICGNCGKTVNRVVKVENSDSDESMVLLTVKGHGSRIFAKEKHQSILGSRWESDDKDFAYAIVSDSPTLIQDLQEELGDGVKIDDSEYCPPDEEEDEEEDDDGEDPDEEEVTQE
jgi:hypothetical protein